MSAGIIFDIKEFTLHDGPGLRTTVFFKGCPLRCRWCHNPEGIGFQPQLLVAANGCAGCGLCRRPCGHPECRPFGRCTRICPQNLIRIAGQTVTAENLAGRLRQQAAALTRDGGGLTFSGGEPLAQPEFLLDLLRQLENVHTIVETSGYAEPADFQQIAAACTQLYVDLKLLDPDRHRRYTGVDNARILRNLTWLKNRDKPFVVRIPLIPGINDDPAHLRQIAGWLADARTLPQVDLLPFNPFTGAKYQMAQMDYRLEPAVPTDLAGVPVEAFRRLGMACRIL